MDNAGRITPVASHPHTVFLSNSRMQHHGVGENNAGVDQSKAPYEAEEPASLADNTSKGAYSNERGKIKSSRRPMKRDGTGSLFNTITGN
jgi:hypothetical protein